MDSETGGWEISDILCDVGQKTSSVIFGQADRREEARKGVFSSMSSQLRPDVGIILLLGIDLW